MAEIWNLPGPDRPNYVTRLGRSFVFLLVLGFGMLISTGLATFGTFGHHNSWLGLVSEPLAAVVNAIVYLSVFKVLTPKAVRSRQLLPGAIVAALHGPSFKQSVDT